MATVQPYVYKATVGSVYDGDTITLSEVRLGFDVTLKNLKIRLHGLDAPELKTAIGKEIKKKVVAALLGKEVVVQTIKDKKEKYGRYLGIIHLDGKNFNEMMIAEGWAKPYDGGKR